MNIKTNLKIWVFILAFVASVLNVTYVYGHAQPSYPSDGALIKGDIVGGNISTNLEFIPGANTVEYTGYFSDDYSKVESRAEDANLGPPPYAYMPGYEYMFWVGNAGVPPITDSLVRGTKYYWTVDSKDALGNTFYGDVWEFAIYGYYAFEPSPPNEALLISTTPVLSWLPGFSVEEHDIYISTSWEDVNNAEYDYYNPPPEFLATGMEPSYQVVSALPNSTKMYWRVDEVVGRSPPLFIPTEFYKGDVWCFTTIPEGLGSIREDLWWDIAGDAVSDLLNDPRYPGNPDEIRMLTSFDSGIALGDDYGGQIHGWLHPVKSGEYTFWLCSDDSSELFLSTDHTPANKVRIAYIEGWSDPYDWYNQGGTNNPYQQSAPISLVGGRKYYIMTRWKEDYAGDHCMVAWQGPDQPDAPVYGSSFAVIKGNRLSPFAQLWAHDPDPCDGQVSVESPVTLRWGPGDNAAEHDVYVGTDKALVESRSLSVYKGRIDSNSYNLGTVFPGMIYYWAIDEVINSGPSPGIWQGDVWSFTTKPAPIFVDDDATGANDGSSWADAYNSLQDGLARADSSVKPVEIRVAQGVYKPTIYAPPPPGAPPPSFDRAATFQLINGVTIKGGYAGFGEADPNARDIDAYETILSGDLAGDDVEVSDPCDLLDEPSRVENSYHVVTVSSTDETAILDGFTITAGNASGLFPIGAGGGMYNDDGSPIVVNCTFRENVAKWGAGMYNSSDSGSIIINCIFRANAGGNGGGLMNGNDITPPLTNCIFIGNLGTGMSGGGILTNCTFFGNSGGAIFGDDDQGTLSLTNCILWGNNDPQIDVYYSPVVNYSCIQGWPRDLGGTGNIGDDPLFVDPNNGDYHLPAGSPCIDAGDPSYMPGPNETDLDGRPRVIGGRIDMGAYEFFNTRPVAHAGDDQVVECACNTAEGTKVALDGSGSYDVDGDALTYKWTGPFAESPADGAAPTVTLEDGCPGEYVIALVVNDDTEDSEPNEVVITVVDTTPPEFTFSVTPTMLWPPNKKMVKITPFRTVRDDCDAKPDVLLVSVSMNESETRGKGHTDDDIQIGEDGTIYVRAERNRKGDRIYTITYQAVDDSGNITDRSATVTVPRKRRKLGK